MKKLILVLAVILSLMSLLLLIAVPIGGVLGLAFGISMIVYALRKTPEPEPEPERRYYSFPIAGLYYHKEDVLDLMDLNDEKPDPEDGEFELYKEYDGPCQLVPEPTNPHDPNAIRVEVDDVLVGYIRKEDTEKVRPLLGNTTYASISGGPSMEYDYDEERWRETENEFDGVVTFITYIRS